MGRAAAPAPVRQRQSSYQSMLIFDWWDTVVSYFKEKPYWSLLQPAFMIVSLYLITLVLAYQFIGIEYHFEPSPTVYLRSYIVKQISVAASVILALLYLFREKESNKYGGIRSYIRHRSWKLVVAGVAVMLSFSLFIVLTPHKAREIRVRFLDAPDFDQTALVYILYELNRIQKTWYFVVDFDVFNEAELTSAQRVEISKSGTPMGIAQLVSDGQPMIGITTKRMGTDYFWQNVGGVSVISTFGWNNFAPPSVYYYLAYTVVVQSIVIQLNASHEPFPAGAFEESRLSSNDLFEFTPRRHAMKAQILAARLPPKTEERLFNAFGPEYVAICSQLLSFDWLNSTRVKDNLKDAFNVSLSTKTGVAQTTSK